MSRESAIMIMYKNLNLNNNNNNNDNIPPCRRGIGKKFLNWLIPQHSRAHEM